MEHWLLVGCPAAPSWKESFTETLFGSFYPCRGVKCAEWALWVRSTDRVGLGLSCILFFLVCLNLWGLHFRVFTATRMNRRGLWKLSAMNSHITLPAGGISWESQPQSPRETGSTCKSLADKTSASDCHGRERICFRKRSSLKRKQRMLQPVQLGDNSRSCAWILPLPVVCVQIKKCIFSCLAQGKRAVLKE